MKRIFLLAALVMIFSACKHSNMFTINGFVNGDTNKFIIINRLDVDNPVFIDSVRINRKGKFRIKVKSVETDFYQLGFSSSDFITLLAEPGEKIDIILEGKNIFNNYKVSGSEGSAKLQILDLKISETKRKLDSLSTLYTKASNEPGFDIAGPALETQFNEVIKAQRKNNITFIIENINSLASIKALYQQFDPESYVLYDQRDLQYFKIVTDSLTHHYPNSRQVKALASDFEKRMNQMYANQIQQFTKNLPETKLDPDLNDINGKRIALSSLRGKYVLLTFWSVRSRECISENLQLKEFYKLYYKKGFEIYQINLDESESDWKSAVKFDELPWISTREDDPLHPKNAVLFNVKNLPTNYLFDTNGKIISSNIHGKSLQLKLEQLFN